MKFKHPSVATRILTIILDYFIFGMVEFFLMLVVVGVSESFHFADWVSITLVIICFFLWLFYVPICETLFHGQTLGKMITRIRVVRTDGSPVSAINCLQRYLVLPFDTIFSLGMGGFISMVVTERRQRLGDIVADTMVIHDSPQVGHHKKLSVFGRNFLTPPELQYVQGTYPQVDFTWHNPLRMAEDYRATEARIANLRTHKMHQEVIEMEELMLADMHVKMYRQQESTIADKVKFVLTSIPRAVYESRWCLIISLTICVIGSIIGIYSQIEDPEFFRGLLGDNYYYMTINNIEHGTPMAVYDDDNAFEMFRDIFINNFLVTTYLYAMGLIVLVGPLFYLINNFVMMGCFVTFFGQHDCLMDALVAVHQHGILELSSIIIVGGASIRLGTGWLFPGKLSRLKAFARGARQSLLIYISVIPMLLVAAIIESFVTRHTEWPMSVRATVLIVSSIIVVGYYVMLPLLAKRD